MNLKASDFSASDNGEFIDFGFYDKDLTYGFGFSRIHGDKRIGMMVADQSIYDLTEAEIRFTPYEFSIELQKGTIKPIDGDDVYHISYGTLSSDIYQRSLALLKNLLKDKSSVLLRCT